MAAKSEAGLLSVVACLFLLASYGWNIAGGCVPYGKDVGNTLNDPTSGAQYRHSTVAATSALNCVGVTFQGDHVLGHNCVGPITTAAVQEEGKDLPSQPVFPTGEHNVQGDKPVTTAPGRRDPIGHGIPATNAAQQVTISAPVAETGAGKTTQPVYGVPTNHSSGTNRQTEETGGGFPSQAVFPTWRRDPPCHGLLGANREHQVNCSAPVAESGTGKTAQLVFKQLSA